jgi:hypothetical protein
VTEYGYRNDPGRDPELYRRTPNPQLACRRKDEQDRRGLQVDTVPIYMQGKIHLIMLLDLVEAFSLPRVNIQRAK